MKVHHLNCGTMNPLGAPAGLVCHVLLLETDGGLVLVDSGFGLRDAADPAGRMGPARLLIRPIFDVAESAIRQIEALGFSARDLRHIVLTHFDADHVGGLADFPWAKVHLTAAEAFATLHPQTVMERERYRPASRAHGPTLVEHTPDGEAWRGFAAAKELTEITRGLVLVSLPGHSRGHAAIAVETGDRCLFHVGDAFYDRRQIDGTNGGPLLLRTMEKVVAVDRKRVQQNHERLAELCARREPDLVLMNAHDPSLLRDARLRA